MIRFLDEYGLKEGDYVPDPILLFEVGRWREESKECDRPKRKKKKENGTDGVGAAASPQPLKVEYQVKNDEAAVTSTANVNYEPRTRRKPIVKRLNEFSLAELESLLEKYVETEEYEKASVIKKEIDKRMENLK